MEMNEREKQAKKLFKKKNENTAMITIALNLCVIAVNCLKFGVNFFFHLVVIVVYISYGASLSHCCADGTLCCAMFDDAFQLPA